MSDPFFRPPIASAPISVVLVARDAAEHLPEVLPAWKKVLDELQREYEIILVDDGSTDGTAKLLDELPAAMPEVKIMRHDAALGFGSALRTGLAEARHPLVCYCTADRQYEPAELHKLLEQINSVDIVSGCRHWRRVPLWYRSWETVFYGFVRVVFGIKKESLPTWLGMEGMGRRRLARWLFNVLLFDPECAFRLFRREILGRIPIQSNGTFAHVEILAKANFLGGLLSEIPVTYHPPPPGGTAALVRGKFSWREIHAVFSQPDFGPITVETWGHTCLSEKLVESAEKSEESKEEISEPDQKESEAADSIPSSPPSTPP